MRVLKRGIENNLWDCSQAGLGGVAGGFRFT